MYNSFSCGFDWHFPSEWGCRTSFHVLICHLCIFFGEMSVQIFLLPPHTFLISLFVFSLNSYYIFWICLINFVIRKYFLPFCDLPFHSLNGIFWWAKILILKKINLSIFHGWLVLSVSYPRNFAYPSLLMLTNAWHIFSYYSLSILSFIFKEHFLMTACSWVLPFYPVWKCLPLS